MRSEEGAVIIAVIVIVSGSSSINIISREEVLVLMRGERGNDCTRQKKLLVFWACMDGWMDGWDVLRWMVGIREAQMGTVDRSVLIRM